MNVLIDRDELETLRLQAQFAEDVLVAFSSEPPDLDLMLDRVQLALSESRARWATRSACKKASAL